VTAGEGQGGGKTMPDDIKKITLRRAQKLRRNMSVSEKVMWGILRKRRLKLFKFRRQHPIPPFIVDFVCLSKKLIIEMDGEHHEQQKHYDEKRTTFLESKGYRVYRITNHDFFNSGEELIDSILNYLSDIK
jgi:very-short-patch-repair endonuclease